MNSFLSVKELYKIGFASIGKNCLISKKASIYGASNIVIGDNVRIDDYCILSGKIAIGNYIHIAAHSCIYGGDEGVTLADYSNISSMVAIYAISDDYSGMSMTNPMIPVELKNVNSKKVVIGKHVIIGTHSVVLPGVILEEGSAFGAFSLINHDSSKWSINAGIPFKKIKDRERNILLLEATLQQRKTKNEQ